jgi:selenocysteine-specific elongation factor
VSQSLPVPRQRTGWSLPIPGLARVRLSHDFALMRHIVLGTAGHIDHGKSALVKALTGVDPDRLKEEQLRGITIDLGFAHLELEGIQIAFVDVPGHERFVKNMLAGVGGIDSVLLVVAADESVMPQTREHFDICRLLGVSSGIVVITKIDLVEPDLIELVREEIRETVRGSFLERAAVIPVSAKTGEGLDDVKASLRALALAVPRRPADRPFRLPVDRAFTMRGFGTVVTGTMVAGQLKKDEEVELIPGGFVAKIRGMQVHGRPADLAVAGQRTAVNLQGVDLSAVERGMTLTVPHAFRGSQVLDVRIDLLPAARALKSFSKVRFHHGTAEVLARVALLGQPALAPGKTAWAQLRLDRPVFCLHGDAFIVRQFSPAATIGGGRILNPLAVKHKVTDRRALALLQSLEQGDMAERLSSLIALHPGQMIGLRELNAALGLAPADLQNHCAQAAAAGALRVIPSPLPILALPAVIESLKKETVSLVERFHRDQPLLRGISREELRKRAYDGLPPEVFRYCLDQLADERRISLQEDMVAAHGREVQMPPAELRIKERIEELLRQAAWQPPSLPEIPALLSADPADVRKICSWMLKEKILVRVTEDIVYRRATIEEMKSRIRDHYRPGARFGVAEFKKLFDLTRKHAIPLLEHLDRERFTRRQGSERILL